MPSWHAGGVFHGEQLRLKQGLVNLRVFVEQVCFRGRRTGLHSAKGGLELVSQVEDLVFGVELVYRAVHGLVHTLEATRDKSVALAGRLGPALGVFEEELAEEWLWRGVQVGIGSGLVLGVEVGRVFDWGCVGSRCLGG